MIEAPLGAWYIWPSANYAYPKHLAAHLGRSDLVILAADTLTVERVLSSAKPVVIDHAARVYSEAMMYLIKRNRLVIP